MNQVIVTYTLIIGAVIAGAAAITGAVLWFDWDSFRAELGLRGDTRDMP